MYQPKKIQWWWEAIIDEMLAHPEWDKRQIAAKLNVTPQTIYNITTTDMFQLRWSQRREQVSKEITEQISNLTGKVAVRALETMYDRLAVESRDKVPLKALTSIADSTLSHLGFSPNLPGKAVPSQSVEVKVTVAPQVLAQAQDKLRQMEAQRAPQLQQLPATTYEEVE
jgi:hypothetical protein